jgi:hypothetical protein
MSDITERLRACLGSSVLCDEAADEIDRLNSAMSVDREAIRELVERVRVLEEALTRIKDMPQRNWHDSPEIARRALEQTDDK